MNHHYEPLVKTLELLASVPRLLICRYVIENQWCTVTEISEGTRLKQSGVSQHLQKLLMGRLVVCETDGVFSRYAFNRLTADLTLSSIYELLKGKIHAEAQDIVHPGA